LGELRMEVGNVYQAKNDIQKQANQRHAHMDKNLQKQMAFDEKLQKLIKEAKRVKPFNCDSVFTENIEFKKKNTLL
jgi:ribosome-binding ATPase YchF (GTP1/OBG family)